MATTIAVSAETKEIMKNVGAKGETYDEIIRKMYEAYEDFLDRQYKRLGQKNKFKKLAL